MPAPADHEALAQRFRPYFKFSGDPGHGGEKVRPVSWQWFVSNSQLSLHGKTVLTQAQLAANPAQILGQSDPDGSMSDIRHAAAKDARYELSPNSSAYGGQTWTDIAGSGAGLYAQVEELAGGYVVLIYWMLFMYNSGTGGPAFDHAGDIGAVSVVYDRTRDMLIRANFVMHGAVLEEFDLQGSASITPATLTGVAVNGGQEAVQTAVIAIADDRQYQNGPSWHSPTKPAQVSFARDPATGRFEHMVAFIEWGTHEAWPSASGSVTAAPQHNGDDVSFLPATIRFLGSLTSPTPAEAPVLFFNGKWGDPPGFIFHYMSCHTGDAATQPVTGAMTDRNPYLQGPNPGGGLSWPPLRTSDPVQAKVSVVCAGNESSAQVALRWGHPNHDTNEYFPLWTIKPGAAQEKSFFLPDANSEFEIQTEGGEGTSYSINIWIDAGVGMPMQPSIVLNHRLDNVPGDQDFVQNNVAAKRSSGLNKYGEQNIRVDTTHAAPGPIQ